MIGWISGCGLCPWSFSRKVGAYDIFQAVQQPTYQAEKKKRAIVQQTKWITDNVATCISLHTIYSVCCRALGGYRC